MSTFVRTILVVEDALIPQSIWRSLQQKGYRVLVAASRADALTAIQSEPPPLIPLNVRLLDLNGVRPIEPCCAARR